MVTSWGIVALVLVLGPVVTLGGVPAQVRKDDHFSEQPLVSKNVQINVTNQDDAAIEIPFKNLEKKVILDHLSSIPGSLTTLADSKATRIMEFVKAAATGWRNSMKSLIEVRHRQRREHALPTKLTRDIKGYWRFVELNENVNVKLNTFTSPKRAISMVLIEHAGLVFWLVTREYTLKDPGNLHVYMLNVESKYLESQSVPTLGAKKCQPVVLERTFMEVVCIEALADRFLDNKKLGSGVYRITWTNGLRVEFKRGLQTHDAQDLTIWKLGSITLLAFANSYDHKRQTGEFKSHIFRVKVTVMSDKEVYCSYDRVDSAFFPTKNAMGVELFTIQSRLFLAVANHHDDKGNVDIDSEIFVFDESRMQLRPVQRIRTSGARDWTAFTFSSGPDAEYFLVVANEYSLDNDGNKNYAVASVIYRYEEDKFVPFQCIQTFGAKEWVAYQGPNGELLIAVLNTQKGVSFYQYNGWTFVPTSFTIPSVGAVCVWVAGLPTTLKNVVVTVSNPDSPSERPRVFYARWQHHNPLSVYHRESLEWCKNFMKRVRTDDLATVISKAGKCTKGDSSYSFQTPVTIMGDLTVYSKTHFSRVHPIEVHSDGITVSDEVSVTISRLYDNLSRLLEVRQVMLSQFANSVKLYQPNLDGLKFSSLHVDCSSGGLLGKCSVTNLLVQEVNGINTSFSNAVKLLESNGFLNLNMSSVAVTAGGMATVTFLWGPGLALTPTSKLVTLNNAYTIVGEKTFGFIRSNELLIAGTVDGVRVDNRNLLLTVGEQYMRGTISIDELSAPFINLNLLNGYVFDTFYSDLVLNDASQNWTGLVHVKSNVVAASIVSTKALTPLDPEIASSSALLHSFSTQQIVTGVHTVGGLAVWEQLTVEETVNGVQIPDNIYLKNGQNEIIHTPVTFVSVAADSIIINSNLDQIQQVDGRLSVLVLSGEQQQVVSSTKLFTDLTLLGNSTVGLKVAGYNLNDFVMNVQQDVLHGLNAATEINGSLTFDDSVFVVDDQLNGVSLAKIRNSALFLSATYVDLPLVFLGPVQITGDLLITGRINGYEGNSYVLTHGSYTFTNAVTFTNGLKVEGNVTTGKMVPYPVKFLASQILLKTKTNQIITRDIYLLEPVMNDLSVSGSVRVSGVDLSDVVLANTDAEIIGQKSFTTLQVLTATRMGEVNVGHCGTIDGIIFNEVFVTDALKKSASGTQTLTGRYMYALVANTVTGTDLGVFEKNVVYKDDAEYITDSILFSGKVSVQALEFGGDFDGVSARDYGSGWLLKQGDQTLTGRNTLEQVTGAAVTLEGAYLQTVDWSRFLHSTAKLDERTIINKASFGLVYGSEIVLDGTIQGWDLSTQALTASATAQTVTGKKDFYSMVFYSGKFDMIKSLFVRETTEDDAVRVDLSTLVESLVLEDEVIHVDSLTVKGDVIFYDNVRILRSLNEVDVNTLTEEFWLSDLPARITALASFQSVVMESDVDLKLKGLMNAVDVETLWHSVLRKECESQQEVSGSFTVDTLTVANVFTFSVDSVNAWDSSDLQDLLLVDGDQVITGLVTVNQINAQASVILDGTVNGFHMDVDFVLNGRPATISGWKTFLMDVSIVGDLNVEPLSHIQGVDVSEFAKSVLLIRPNGTVFIPGVTTFRGLRILKPLIVGSTVDGVEVSRDNLLVKSGAQTVHGDLTIVSPPNTIALGAKMDISIQENYLNNIDLERLGSLTVPTTGEVIITGSVLFLNDVAMTEILLMNDLINGYNITDLALCLLGHHIVENMGNKLEVILEIMQDIKDVLAGGTEAVWYYEEQKLPTQLYKLIPIQLTGELDVNTWTTLVGLDRAGGRLLIYNITNLVQLYPAIDVVKPVAAVGMGQDLVAVCGIEGMAAAAPLDAVFTSTYKKLSVENGSGLGYGHIYWFGEDEVMLEAAFQIKQCRDLVSFRIGEQVCVAVLDYSTSSSVLCKMPSESLHLMTYLPTERAIKGAWLVLTTGTFIIIAEAGTTTLPSRLKIFKYKDTEGRLTMVQSLASSGLTSVSVFNGNSEGVIAITSRQTMYMTGKVVLLRATPTSTSLALTRLQTLEVKDAVDSSLGMMPTGEVALYLQTKYRLLIYLLKGSSFILEREIKTTPAMYPFSFPFLHTASNTPMVAYTGTGLVDEYDDLPTLQQATPTLYKSVYRSHTPLSRHERA